ncbi:MAG: GTPase Era [Gammaproteobacteria bacterium]|nr:GTPase Era [Gammaproteobacteria bacterium]
MKTGFISIVGRPNVGKSTLLNKMLGQKISITSRKPQTTRHTITGIRTTDSSQMIFVDTPGIHKKQPKAMNQYMNRSALQSLHDVDLVLFVVEGTRWTDEDENVLQKLQTVKCPVILLVNKIDVIKEKEQLLPHLKTLSEKYQFHDVIPVSAKHGDQLGNLYKVIEDLLPEGQAFYSEDQITDRSSRFLASEIVREKLMRTLGQELPYALTVEIEQFKDNGGLLEIAAVCWVERKGQKAILIGKQGSKLKEIGKQARIDMEKLFDQKVFLQLWVKVKEGWSDDIRALRSLGYNED